MPSHAELERIKRVYRARQVPAVAARYSPANPFERYLQQRRTSATLELLGRHGWSDLRSARILDVGCGRGHRLAEWQDWGAGAQGLAGIDLLEEFVRDARASYPELAWMVAGGDQLPFADGSFDVVNQATLFTSILDTELRRQTSAEMCRVVKRNGLILWYDFRVDNPANRNVRGIGRHELTQLFPGCSIDLHSIVLAPPLARALGTAVHALAPLVEILPFLRTHYLAAIRPM